MQLSSLFTIFFSAIRTNIRRKNVVLREFVASVLGVGPVETSYLISRSSAQKIAYRFTVLCSWLNQVFKSISVPTSDRERSRLKMGTT